MTYSGSSAPKYNFPQVVFNESVESTAVTQTRWRKTIGVVAPFKSGPLLASLNSRKQAVSLFGDDDSLGSEALKRALDQGADDFIVSRVLPIESESSSTLSFSNSSDPSQNDAVVGVGNVRTIGLQFTLENISPPIFTPGSFRGVGEDENQSKVENLQIYLNSPEDLSAFNLDAYQQLNISVGLDKVIRADSAFALYPQNNAIRVTLDVGSGLQIMKIRKNLPGVYNYLPYIVPGIKLAVATLQQAPYTPADNNVSPPVPEEVEADRTLEFNVSTPPVVVGYPFDYDEDYYGVLVEGIVTAAGVDDPVVFNPVYEDSNYYIFSLQEASGRSIVLNQWAYKLLGDSGYSHKSYFTIPVDLPVNHTSYLVFITQNPTTKALSYTNRPDHFSFTIGKRLRKLYLGGRYDFNIVISKSSVSVGETNPALFNSSKAFTTGSSGLDILTQLQTAILRNTQMMNVLADVKLVRTSLPYSLVFISFFKGQRANGIRFKLDRIYGNMHLPTPPDAPTDINFVNGEDSLFGTTILFTGGKDSIESNHCYLYDDLGYPLVYIETLSPDAKNVYIDVRPLTNGSFQLEVYYRGINNNTGFLQLPKESYTLSNYFVDVVTGLYNETLNSGIIRAYFIPVIEASGAALDESVYLKTPMRLAPVNYALNSYPVSYSPLHPNHSGQSYLKNIALTNNGENYIYTDRPEEEDYIAAVRRLESEDVAFIIAPGLAIGDIRYQSVINELVSQANSSTVNNGLRIAVLNTPSRLTASRALQISGEVSSPSVVAVSGYSTYSGAYSRGTNRSTPDAYYTAILSNLDPQYSPAIISQSTLIRGIKSLDTNGDLNSLSDITAAGVEVMYFDTATKTYRFLNGRTTSRDSDYKWVSVIRVGHHLLTNLNRNLTQNYLSQPISGALTSRISASCDAYLTQELNEGTIVGFLPTIVSRENNSATDIESGRVNITLRYQVPIPANEIGVEMKRVVSLDFIFGT